MSDRDEAAIARARETYDAFNRGDFDAAVELLHPQVELIRAAGLPPVIGADAVRDWAEPEVMLDFRMEPLDFRANGNKVLVRQRTTARGAGSGIELDLLNWTVLTFGQDGRVTRLENFLDHQEADAMRAAGFSE